MYLSLEVTDVSYTTPGHTMVCFRARYPMYTRRGKIAYNVGRKVFMSHNKEVRLLADACVKLRTFDYGRSRQ